MGISFRHYLFPEDGSLMPELKRRALDARDRWTLTADDLDRIAADLWPGVHGPAPDVSTVKGKAPRKPR